MFQIIKQWFHRYFSDPEAVLLFFVLTLGFGVIVWLGGILAPLLVAIVFAYLLESMVGQLQKFGLSRLLSVWIVYIGFLGLFLSLLLLLPLIWQQLATLFEELPLLLPKGQKTLQLLSERFPSILSQESVNSLMAGLVQEIRGGGKAILSASLSSIPSFIAGILYTVLVPLLVFFFLKDRQTIMQWVVGFLPEKRGLLQKVSIEVEEQIGRYISGKVTEIILVSVVTYLVFLGFGLNYAALLAVLVGLSVLIPYVGAVVVTLPVILVGWLQWGWCGHFGYLLLAYLIVQGLDANLLVPLLFSEAVNLHPVAIVTATLVFGGLFGFWGVFFAIPLATLVKAVFNAWPRQVE